MKRKNEITINYEFEWYIIHGILKWKYKFKSIYILASIYILLEEKRHQKLGWV